MFLADRILTWKSRDVVVVNTYVGFKADREVSGSLPGPIIKNNFLLACILAFHPAGEVKSLMTLKHINISTWNMYTFLKV